jgi:hypothetical protein
MKSVFKILWDDLQKPKIAWQGDQKIGEKYAHILERKKVVKTVAKCKNAKISTSNHF